MMSINIEKEERAMISKETYQSMVETECHNIVPIKQTNYYFDTTSKLFLSNHKVLRIRFISIDNIEITLKEKLVEEDKENNIPISYDLFNKIINLKQEILITELGLTFNADVNLLTSLSTLRYEIDKNEYLLVIDKNEYNNIVDYNIEIESNISRQHAKKIIIDYSKKYHFDYNENYISKSRRAISNILNN